MATWGLGLFGLLWSMVKLTSEAFDPAIAGYLGGGRRCWSSSARRAGERNPMLDFRIFRVPTMTPSLFAACSRASRTSPSSSCC